MEILTFISSVIDSLIWPVITLCIILVFRKPLLDLLSSLNHAVVKVKKGKVSLEIEINALREQNSSLPSEKPPEPIQKIAENDPDKAIEISWDQLFKKAIQTAELPMNSSVSETILKLVKDRKLDLDNAFTFFKLNEIKGEIEKSNSRFYADTASAGGYSTIAYGISEKLGHNSQMETCDNRTDNWGIIDEDMINKFDE